MFENTRKCSMYMRGVYKGLLLLLFFAGFASAQTRYTPAELDTLVATIALYPDPLLVQVLEASMHVDDIPRAATFANAHRNLTGDGLASAIERADLDYDESVIALIPFPDVLRKMSKYATWTKQLGEAVDMQKADVMDAIQRMRKTANKNGYLKSDDKIAVTVDENVWIQPVREEYVYVPEYDPRVVYYVVSDGNVRLRYVNGVWTGAGLVYWGWDPFYYDWGHRRSFYRNLHRHLPPRRSHAVRPPKSRFDNPPPRPMHESRPVPPPSNYKRPAAPPPPPPSKYKRPSPPPPPQTSSDGDDDSRRLERRGSNNPPPPPHRRR